MMQTDPTNAKHNASAAVLRHTELDASLLSEYSSDRVAFTNLFVGVACVAVGAAAATS